jgi:hypothetical protein
MLTEGRCSPCGSTCYSAEGAKEATLGVKLRSGSRYMEQLATNLKWF